VIKRRDPTWRTISGQSLRLALIAGIVLTVVFGITALLAVAGGDGTYMPAALFFPGALLCAIGLSAFTNFTLIVAAAQWPLYLVIFSISVRKGHKRAAIACLSSIHLLLLGACFLLDRQGQFL
jgi:hypothetical protein